MMRLFGYALALSLSACATRIAEPGASATTTNASAATPSRPAPGLSAAPPSPSLRPSSSPANLSASPESRRLAEPQSPSLSNLDESLRKRLGTDGTRRFEFLRSICPLALQHNQNRWLVGCRVCPPFNDASPDGKAPEVGFDAEEFYELEGLTPGSFTRAGADEMAAVFSGCEAAGENRGGTLLAARGADGLWASLKYESGLHPNSCLAFRRPDGRDLLVCRWEYAHQGTGHANILVQDFARASAKGGKESLTNLVVLEDDAVGLCMDSGAKPSWAADTLVTTGRIDGFEILPASNDRPPGLVVRAHASRGKATAAYLTLCRNWLHEKVKANPRYIDVRPGLNAPALRLVFLWNGSNLEPNLATKAMLQKLVPTPE